MSDDQQCNEPDCGTPPQFVRENGYCDAHQPDGQGSEEMSKRGYEGGKKPKYPGLSDLPEPESYDDIRTILGRSVRAVASGEMKPKVANAISRLARAWREAHEGHLHENQIAEMKEKMEELKRQQDQQMKPWQRG